MGSKIVEQFRDKVTKQVLERSVSSPSVLYTTLISLKKYRSHWISSCNKPPAGAGATATYRVNNWEEAKQAWQKIQIALLWWRRSAMG